MTQIGKRVLDDLYVHLQAITLLDHDHQVALAQALRSIPEGHQFFPNVGKLNLRVGSVSLLCYPSFDDAPFPELAASWTFRDGPRSCPQLRIYVESLNPPVLHRKELLVAPEHPSRGLWMSVTAMAEAVGLFDEKAAIGFKLNWERQISLKGFCVSNGSLQPIGNETLPGPPPGGDDQPRVSRHLTALTRTTLSAPVQLLMRHGLLTSSHSFFDYGCGRGNDVSALKSAGVPAGGWDPHYAPLEAQQHADVVNLGFVINVIEDPAERVQAVERAFALARHVLSVSVMLTSSDNAGIPFNDGLLTSRRTFQKYYTQAELRDYLEEVLHRPAFMVGPGIAFVFADSELEQRFSAGRLRSRHVADRVLQRHRFSAADSHLSRRRRGRTLRTPNAERQLTESKPLLDRLWSKTLDLGRLPCEDEFEDAHLVRHQLKSWVRALRLIRTNYDLAALETSKSIRRDDVALFFVEQLLSRRTPYRKLEPGLQRDVKAFFGDYASALVSAQELLRSASDSQSLLVACAEAAESGLGLLSQDHSLQLHIDLIDRLPAVLRAYVACGLVLWDHTSNVQLIKIHIGSKKLTFLEYDEFDASPIPLLRRRVKVGLGRLSCEVFDYGGSEFPMPPLFWKSRFLHEDYPLYAEQVAFEEKLIDLGITEGGEPKSSAELAHWLSSRRLEIAKYQLVPSTRVPLETDSCGAHFSFRDLIECGETQHRTGASNVPREPATYNALLELATNILDPVIEYYGAIKLTYGVCCPELRRLIPGRIAPELDQHASHERGARGARICKRDGAACDFIVEDEDMYEVALWIKEHLPFDRLYFYGREKPIHVSYGPLHSRTFVEMREGAQGRLIPRVVR